MKKFIFFTFTVIMQTILSLARQTGMASNENYITNKGSINYHTISGGSTYMKKILFSLTAAALLIIGSLVMPHNSEAVPAFARQTGFSCNCVFRSMPTSDYD